MASLLLSVGILMVLQYTFDVGSCIDGTLPCITQVGEVIASMGDNVCITCPEKTDVEWKYTSVVTGDSRLMSNLNISDLFNLRLPKIDVDNYGTYECSNNKFYAYYVFPLVVHDPVSNPQSLLCQSIFTNIRNRAWEKKAWSVDTDNPRDTAARSSSERRIVSNNNQLDDKYIETYSVTSDGSELSLNVSHVATYRCHIKHQLPKLVFQEFHVYPVYNGSNRTSVNMMYLVGCVLLVCIVLYIV